MNHPEMLLEGQIGSKGCCEYTYISLERPMLLLIELMLDLRSLSIKNFSNIIAQVCAEADGNFFLTRSNF